MFFFKFGWVAFGGPAAHISLMEEELVKKRKWLTSQEFLDYMGMTSLIPGPNSTEMTMHMGYHRGGVKGLFLAGIGFIMPAVFITLMVAIFYQQVKGYDFIPAITAGIKAAVLSFIVAAIYKLGKKSVKNGPLLVAGILAVIAAHFDVNEIYIILGIGFLGMLISVGKRQNLVGMHAWMILLAVAPSMAKASKIFLIFLKVGSVLFGSGYVLFAYLDGELIDKLGWLDYDQLVEAVAVGQMTPGPVLSTATFIGYELGGVPGALSATLGIFLPAFLFVWLLNPIVHKMRSSPLLTSFLDYVNVAAVAVMLYVTYEMALSVITAPWLIGISIISLVAYFKISNLSPFVIIIGGGVAGYLAYLLQIT